MSTLSAQLYLDTKRTIDEISPLIFGGFAEHMGRCIYEGIYDPKSPHADERGLRRDVLAVLRELNFRIIRYPGGNFLSGYNWLDGVGPREKRPVRRDMAWHSLETNQFGTDEFMEFCRLLGTQPMLAVNLGTGTIEEAANLVEYCNARPGSYYADLRVANGHPEPYGVKCWCLGNEMDGPWQIGHLDMDEYGRKAREAAKVMKYQDPSIKLVLCGSSSAQMPTYPEWDRVALETCWELVDYHSMHYYAGNRDNDTASYLAEAAQFEAYVDTLAGTLRYVKGKLRSQHDVYLSWDEWNVWYKNQEMDGQWKAAPHLIEEIYNLEDALVVAQWLNVFLRKCDVLKIACLAQIVNVIAPILTTTEGLVKQTIFYPFMLVSKFARGQSLAVATEVPMISTSKCGDMPALDVSASHDPATGRSAVFIVNRSQTDALSTDIIWQSEAPRQIAGVYQIAGSDVKAANTFEHPDTIVARQVTGGQMDGNKLSLQLPPLSFTVVSAG
ncbi:MAG: alpha-N-arabinofuranosidase [Thermoflexales bacterium]|nr:alpha-N-arabinofuranosidase [Thermoflexales bacterium]